jgi:squalene synthase HpnC
LFNLISQQKVENGYREALSLVKAHYENFPVVSLLIPAKFRKDIAIIYWFARTADDISDEGNFSAAERLEKLQAFESDFNSLLHNDPKNDYEAALKETITKQNLNTDNFFNLLKAFKQDVAKTRYENFNEVLDYCSNSANPVGRILLELFEITDTKAFNYSDKICTALQITNFIQDTKIDFNKGRIYYPLDEMNQFGVSEKMFEENEISLNLNKLIEFSVDRVQKLFDEGKGILNYLSGRFRYEIAWTIKGGEEILHKIRGAEFDVLKRRPYLSKSDYLKLFFNSFLVK